jgi:HAE1 family hydrophobic/amphiphilic exporter-1
MSIPRLAIHRPVTMFMISGVITLLGFISLTRLPVDLMPEFEQPQLTVRVGYAGVGPLEIEELITRPIEQAVSAVPGLTRIESSSSEGNSQVRLNFDWGKDLSEAADEVRTRVDRMRGRLPAEAEPPTIFKFDSTALPIMQLGIEGDDYDPVTLRELVENEIVPRFERVDGVAAVGVNGGVRREIHVELSKEKITALNLSVDRIVQTLRQENQNTPLGEVYQGDSTFLLRSQGQFTSLEDIRNLVVMTREGVPVYLRDIADVRDSTEQRRSFMRINGQPGVQLQIQKQSGTNTVQVARAVVREMERTNREVPGVKVMVMQDTSTFIQRAINNVQEHAMAGGVIVVLIIFLFLRDFRSTLIVCTSIPVSVIGTFALLYFGGYTLNTMTFGGLALGVGMIVDAAIVVLENTQRHMEMGKSRWQAAIDGSEEIWSAIVASTLTHVAVFVPFFFLTGVSSVLFGQLAVVVIFSLSMSLFVAVTLVPVLCSLVLTVTPAEERRGVTGRLFLASERVLARADEVYRRILRVALVHRPTVLATGAALFATAVLLLPTLKYELLPQADEGEVTIDAELAVGTRIERTEAVMLELEERVRQHVPEAVTILTSVGGGGFMGSGSTHRGSINVRLVSKTERARSNEQIAVALRRQLAGLPGAAVRARPSGGNWVLSRVLGGGSDARLALEIRGHELDDSARLAREAKLLMETTPGVADVRIGREEGRPEMAIRVDRDKAALFGLTVSGVAETLRTNIAGTQAAFYRERGNEYPIVVRLREEDRAQVSAVGDLLVSMPGGRVVQARNLLQVRPEAGPLDIERKNQERVTRVNAEVEVPLSQAVAAVQARLGEIRVPRDFTVGFGAEVEEQAKAFRQLQLLLVLAIVLVYAVMASQYESLRDPFIIMFSIPLAAIGVVGSLKLTGTTFSMQAYIGVIMLAGIVVSNAILLVDYTNTLRRRDKLPLFEAVERAGRTRLRPILMTTLTTILGLLPMSLGLGEGAELQAPLARVVIGGLAASSIITLVFVPTVYTLFEGGLAGLRRDVRAAPVPAHEPAPSPGGSAG